jgi:hypothetical protein
VRPVLAALAVAFAAGCHVVDAKAWNLAQLHDANGHHKYTGAMEGDFEYYLRHVVTRSLTGNLAHVENKSPSAIENPSESCLENLISLEGFAIDDPRNRGLQVEWFSRLAVADPSRLSRERAVLALGRAGERLRPGNPEPLPKDSTPAGPSAVGEALAGLVRAAKPVLEKGGSTSPTEALDLESACQVVLDLPLDIDGARRMLHAGIDIGAAVGFDRKEAAPVTKLCEELERRCIRFALAAALRDQDPLVRGAAVEASVESVGNEVFDPVLRQLPTDPSAEVVLRVLALVRRYGLPSKPPAGANVTQEVAQRARFAAIYALLDRPESTVRVAAMLALERVTDANLHSLREEDWQAWWKSSRKPEAPAAPEKPAP